MNRQQRRKIEKQLGYHKKYKNMTPEERAEVKAKKLAASKQIEKQNYEENLNKLLKEDEERDERIIKSFIDSGKTLEQAKEILTKNKELERKRKEKQKQKRLRQKQQSPTKK